MPQKVIRDPVHNHIYLDETKDALVLRLLACREVQRLRRIRQLGVGHQTYPGAEHSRFAHALGVTHLMKMALRYVHENQADDRPVSEEHRLAGMAAALLHDIGHAPFSHALEELFGGKHEKRTIELITHQGTEVNEVLSSVDPKLPDLVTQVIAGQDREILWLRSLMSSQLDVDRMDYLLRDSHCCGVPYGIFDYQWIFHTMRIVPVPPDDLLQPVWLEKATRAIEEYIFARYYMYWAVYYHKTTRGYEELLKAILRRARDLLRDGGKLFACDALRACLAGDVLGSSDFLKLDDSVVMHHFVQWEEHQDRVLADLCGRFLNRRGLKPVAANERVDETTQERTDRVNAIRKTLDDAGCPADYYLHENVAIAQAYDYYHPEKEECERTSANSILILHEDGVGEISSRPGMERLRAVTGRRERRCYYYVPEEQRDAVRTILRRATGGAR